MSLAPSALVQLDSAYELFSKAATGFRAEKVLVGLRSSPSCFPLTVLQDIMMRLRVRAHQSLDDFRKGKGSPISRHHMQEPQSPTNDDDELAMLGGKTRLVKKEEPSSPLLLDRSPNTQNPVVPLPLSAGVDMDHNMLDYLSSFAPNNQSQQQPVSASSHTSFSSIDMSPVAMYSMPNVSPTSAYPPETPYMSQPQQTMMQSQPSTGHHRSSHSISSNGNGMNGSSHSIHTGGAMGGQTNSFPQYFPVYDYGTGLSSMSMDTGYGSAPLLESNPRPQAQRRSGSGSPEANNIHSTWQDFVAMQMN